MRLAQLFPSPDDLLQLEPEDLAFLLLKCLSEAPSDAMSRYNFCRRPEFVTYSGPRSEEIEHAISEAWGILEREGLLAIRPNDAYGIWAFVTRRGRALLAQ